MKDIEIGDLPPVGFKVTGDYGNEAEVFELPDGSVESRFTTPWLIGKVGRFRVYLAIVYGKDKQPQDSVPLTGRQAERALHHVTHLVKSFMKQAL